MEINLLPWREQKSQAEKTKLRLMALISIVSLTGLLSILDGYSYIHLQLLQRRLVNLRQRTTAYQLQTQFNNSLEQMVRKIANYRRQFLLLINFSQSFANTICFSSMSEVPAGYQIQAHTYSMNTANELLKKWQSVIQSNSVTMQTISLRPDTAILFSFILPIHHEMEK